MPVQKTSQDVFASFNSESENEETDPLLLSPTAHLQQSPGVVGAVAEAGTTVKDYITRKIYGNKEDIDKQEEATFQTVESRKHKRSATKSAEKVKEAKLQKTNKAQ